MPIVVCVIVLLVICAQAKTQVAYPTLNRIVIKTKVALKTKLKMKNYTGKVTWKSQDKKIATVSENGAVIGRKKGSTYVYAELKNGRDLWCYVSVKKNQIVLQGEDIRNDYSGTNFIDCESKKLFFNSNRRLCYKVKMVNPTWRTYEYKSVKVEISSYGDTHRLAKHKFGLSSSGAAWLEGGETGTITLVFPKSKTKKIVDLKKWFNKHGGYHNGNSWRGSEVFD